MDILPKIWPKFPETFSEQAWNELNIDKIVRNSNKNSGSQLFEGV